MRLFLAGFFSLYTLLHLYLFVRARSAIPAGPASAIVAALFMVVMIAAPALTRMAEFAGLRPLARFAAYVGYTWMALLFLFFCASIIVDALRLAVYLAGLLSGKTGWLTVSVRSCFLFACFAALAVAVYGSFEARAIRTERVTIATTKIPARVSPLRIVQISDVHLGLTVGADRLGRIMKAVEAAKPDVVVSTGDLVDGIMNGATEVVEMLAATKPRFGKFAVTGNHEFYAGLAQSLAFTEDAGFRVLRGEAIGVADAINIVGVDDPAGPGYGSTSEGEADLLRSCANGRFALFLKHRPTVDGESLPLFDLQLSGHVHDGQIFPFRLITRLFYPLIAGLYSFPPGGALYVSRGSGTWGPPIRFLSPPEVTVIEIVRR